MDKCLKSTNGTDTAGAFRPEPAPSERTRSCWKKALGMAGTLAALFVLLCTGCQTQKPTGLPRGAASQAPGVLGSGDTIRISFTGAPELNQTQRIGTDGKLSLPLVG